MSVTMHPLISPNEGRAVDQWPVATDGDIAAAIARASRSALKLAVDHGMRRERLQAILSCVSAARADLARLMVIEVAKTPAEADSEVDYAISFIRYALDLMSGHKFEHTAFRNRRIVEVPYGPALLITPFNDPLAGILRKLAPAIAAGCPVIVKPSPFAAATALRLDRAILEAGAGDVVAIVAATDIETVVRLINDDHIGMVSFTGSTSAGLSVARVSAGAAKHCVTELGGNNPFVIFEDADIDMALADFFRRKLSAAGQACSSINRLFVHRVLFERARHEIAQRLSGLKLDRSDADPDLAPVISAQAMTRLRGMAGAALGGGGRSLAPVAHALPIDGPFLVPLTIFETTEPSIMDEQEAFGPLAALSAFDDPVLLFDRLARERHMLVAYGYSADTATILPLMQRLPAGSIGLNSTGVQGPEFPTGGFGLSGRGREGGVWGFREFLTTRNIVQRQ